jgi:hypothetical protein
MKIKRRKGGSEMGERKSKMEEGDGKGGVKREIGRGRWETEVVIDEERKWLILMDEVAGKQYGMGRGRRGEEDGEGEEGK